jgi:hypothetical protein
MGHLEDSYAVLTPGPAVPGRALWVRIALFESRKVRAEKEKLKHPPA